MSLELRLVACSFPLPRPYALSFGSLTAFTTYYVLLGEDVGEATLLEGYGSEGVMAVPEAVAAFSAAF